ncbi:MAG: nuclear transport factor 2 family protein [Archangium sp.]|nr:nuclear transport factor 2 family protein [Archangium sp.]MDP3153718.1 nuclear transport factor 2 family protein [Archangium sp.]MDP3569233.1 nuclear transport factor 2 family protein [Archangium sp.]
MTKTLEVVKAYYRAWTTKNFAAAGEHLAPTLVVEVPVNDYPTVASFLQALSGFGSMTKRIELLAEFANDAEAMLLYDMDVEGLGTIRIAEHFTVEDGKISRLRQIHDTHAIRAAGFVKT